MPSGCEICDGPTAGWRLAADCELNRCEQCGHLRRDLVSAPAGHRDLAYGGEPALDRVRLALTFRELRAATAARSVFEIGFGTGSLLRRFLGAGLDVGGADPDQLGLAVDPMVRAQGKLFASGIEDVPPDAVQADLVYGIHVLEHVHDPARTLEVAHDLLAPGGQVQFFTPAGDSWGLRRYRGSWWMLEDPTHVRFFTAESARRALAAAGFVDIEVRRPVLDSLTTDIGSLARRVSRRPRPHGVLGSTPVLAAGLATAPLVAALRTVSPVTRPTLHLIARRPR
ncbi:class I SAM-dependent methyltransferase [Calidifontibacter terrae]